MDGPIAEAERVRFIWYAQHIRILHIRFDRRVDPTVFEHLPRAGLGSPLLPRLHTLYSRWWECCGLPNQGAAVVLLRGPALRSLSISFPSPNAGAAAAEDDPESTRRSASVIHALLARVAVSVPGLESLTVNTATCMTLLKPVGALHALRRLDLSMLWLPFDVDFLRALVTLERLEELLLSDMFVAQDATPCSGFKSVRKLTVRGSSGMFTVPDLLAALPDLRLTELRMAGVQCKDVEQIQALGEVLCSGPGQCLGRLTLHEFSSPAHCRQGSVTGLLAPFFALQGIRHFTVDSFEPLMVEDEDLRRIGRAWPKLERLQMSCDISEGKEVVAPTIEGIVELANMCQGLEGIQLSAIMPAMAHDNVIPPISLEAKTIQRIALDVRIPDEQIRDVGQVTRVLHTAVGKLLVPGLDMGRYKRWSAVLDGMSRLSRG